MVAVGNYSVFQRGGGGYRTHRCARVKEYLQNVGVDTGTYQKIIIN
jgi:hypothetical protein